jgi:hypothetical protein
MTPITITADQKTMQNLQPVIVGLLPKRCEMSAHVGHARADNQPGSGKKPVDTFPNCNSENRHTGQL